MSDTITQTRFNECVVKVKKISKPIADLIGHLILRRNVSPKHGFLNLDIFRLTLSIPLATFYI